MLGGMTPREPMESHMFRVPAALWKAAKGRAVSGPRKVVVPLNGDETVSEALRKFLERYVR